MMVLSGDPTIVAEGRAGLATEATEEDNFEEVPAALFLFPLCVLCG
jgi:hypothetical protein